MGIIRSREKFLDDKMCFILWAELGSLPKAVRHITQDGYVNPRTKKPFTRSGVHQSARRYMLENADEARKVFLQHGDTRTQEEWEEYLVKLAAHVYGEMSSRTRFYRWLKRNNFKEKYEYAWKPYVYLDDFDEE